MTRFSGDGTSTPSPLIQCHRRVVVNVGPVAGVIAAAKLHSFRSTVDPLINESAERFQVPVAMCNRLRPNAMTFARKAPTDDT